MKVSHETPISLLNDTLRFKDFNYNDFDYALVHLFDKYPEYYKFSGYSSVLIIFQIILIFSYLRGNMACMTSVSNPMADPSIGTLYLSVTLFILNGLCVGIMEVILRLFSTCF